MNSQSHGHARCKCCADPAASRFARAPLPWSERWQVFVPAWVAGLAFCVALWGGHVL